MVSALCRYKGTESEKSSNPNAFTWNLSKTPRWQDPPSRTGSAFIDLCLQGLYHLNAIEKETDMPIAVNLKNAFVLVFLIGTTVSFLLNHVLEAIDYRWRKQKGGVLPEILKKYPESQMFDQEKLKKICAYENAKYFLWIPQSIVNYLLEMGLVLFGFYVFIFDILVSWVGMPTTVGKTFVCFFLFMFLTALPSDILSIPFSLYREFKLEKRFGFSNMTLKIWITDGIKNLIVSLVLNVMLTGIAAPLLVSCPSYWWVILSLALMLIVFLTNIIYPKFIAPLFNKFQPLEDGELRSRLENMLKKSGFSSDGLFRMDASKRSNHSNAYFTGFGKAKRIVLYDTLISSLTIDEIESVMAHEVGHYKLKHITRRLVLMFPLILVACFAMFTLSHVSALYTGFGFEVTNINAMQFVGLQLAIMVFSSVSFPLKPVTSSASRRHEYEADKFSAELCHTGKPLVTALMKLNSENLSEILPPKIYSFFHYSHPTLVERTTALEELEKGLGK